MNPKINGSVKRFTQSSIRQQAGATPLTSSNDGQTARHPPLSVQNTSRPHFAIGVQIRQQTTKDNLPGSDSYFPT